MRRFRGWLSGIGHHGLVQDALGDRQHTLVGGRRSPGEPVEQIRILAGCVPVGAGQATSTRLPNRFE